MQQLESISAARSCSDPPGSEPFPIDFIMEIAMLRTDTVDGCKPLKDIPG